MNITWNQILRYLKVSELTLPWDYLDNEVPYYILPDLDESEGSKSFNPKLMMKYGQKKPKNKITSDNTFEEVWQSL